jgi:hypothetical protein
MQFYNWAAVQIEQQDRWQRLYEGYAKRQRLGLTNESIDPPGPRALLAALLLRLAFKLDRQAGARPGAQPGLRTA